VQGVHHSHQYHIYTQLIIIICNAWHDAHHQAIGEMGQASSKALNQLDKLGMTATIFIQQI
jgi:hypothetical protein